MKIYITGCAKTGTTLVRRLFNAFDLSVYNSDEMDFLTFISSGFEVAKRTWDAPFSNIMSEPELLACLTTLKTHKVVIVNCVRNKAAVLKSDNGWVKPERYDACMKQASDFANYIHFTIVYEDLIADPDKVQKQLSKTLKLTPIHKWSEYPDFVDITLEKEHTHNGNYSLRRIGAKHS